jgi:hypothetical protein
VTESDAHGHSVLSLFISGGPRGPSGGGSLAVVDAQRVMHDYRLQLLMDDDARQLVLAAIRWLAEVGWQRCSREECRVQQERR